MLLSTPQRPEKPFTNAELAPASTSKIQARLSTSRRDHGAQGPPRAIQRGWNLSGIEAFTCNGDRVGALYQKTGSRLVHWLGAGALKPLRGEAPLPPNLSHQSVHLHTNPVGAARPREGVTKQNASAFRPARSPQPPP